MTALPLTSIADTAVDMFLVASQEADGVRALEANALKLHRSGLELELCGQADHEARERMWKVFELSLLRARSNAKASSDALEWLKVLAPFEAEIRVWLLEKLKQGAAA